MESLGWHGQQRVIMPTLTLTEEPVFPGSLWQILAILKVSYWRSFMASLSMLAQATVETVAEKLFLDLDYLWHPSYPLYKLQFM